jgi:hypothetical protein
MNSILSLIITLTASVFSGIVVFLFKNFLRRQQEKEEMREKEKATETALILRSLIALGKLTVANTLALRDGKSRKEINEALKEYKDVETALYEHLISSHVEKTS